MQDVGEQREVAATAALRSAVAWSRRRSEPRAWREVARMAGVIMRMFPPGSGPLTPAEVVASLHRPLGELLPRTDEPSELDGVVLLDSDDILSDEAMEIVCDYARALFDSEDPATTWLPRWAWQRAEQVERELFQALIDAGDAAVYTASRRFVVEYPAGDTRGLAEARGRAGARQVARYHEIPSDRIVRGAGSEGGQWWPCPVCGWPMQVRGQRVECTYRPHAARFLVTDDHDSSTGMSTLVKVSATRLRVPKPRPAASAACVDPAVWRFVVVPGVPELELERLLRSRIAGLDVALYPMKDVVDLRVTAPDGQIWNVDVKDHADPQRVIDDPPAAEHVVLPDYRKGQLHHLRRALPRKSVWTIRQFLGAVRDHVSMGGRA